MAVLNREYDSLVNVIQTDSIIMPSILVTLALSLPVGKGNNFFLKRQERQPKMYRLPLYYLLLTFACSINLFFFFLTKCLYFISKDFL